MDAIALDTGGFWQGGPSDGMGTWQGGGEEDDGGDDLSHGISSQWERGSLVLQDPKLAEADDFVCGYSGYGFGAHEEWGTHTPDPDLDGLPVRRGEKRRSDSLSGDGFGPTPAPNSPLLQSSASKQRNPGTGSLFFKTKLCIKFKAGTCPYNSTCNFAHGMDELRKPPPGWEDMVGGAQDVSAPSSASAAAVPSSADSVRFRRTRRCKKYYTDEGCPYGERCNFLHDDQAKNRESNAISLGPTTGNASGGGSGIGGVGVGSNERPSNWKTRMCNKWEMTGHCPFGQKCNFAHGLAELQMYAGAPSDVDPRISPMGSGISNDSKQTAARALPKSVPDVGASYVSTMLVGEGLMGSRQRSTYAPSSKSQKQTKDLANWKGPADEISTIYGDWIEDDE